MDGKARRLAAILQMNAQMGGMPGQQGAQSGPVQESDSAYYERLIQEILGMGVGVGGGTVGMAAGSAGGPLGTAAGGAFGVAPGAGMMVNANTPNIQDVWAHQLMQKLRR